MRSMEHLPPMCACPRPRYRNWCSIAGACVCDGRGPGFLTVSVPHPWLIITHGKHPASLAHVSIPHPWLIITQPPLSGSSERRCQVQVYEIHLST